MFNYEPDKQANDYKGYAAIIYSCKEWQKSVEKFDAKLPYAEQEKGHTVGAKYIFDTIAKECCTFDDFKKHVMDLNSQNIMLQVFNE